MPDWACLTHVVDNDSKSRPRVTSSRRGFVELVVKVFNYKIDDGKRHSIARYKTMEHGAEAEEPFPCLKGRCRSRRDSQ